MSVAEEVALAGSYSPVVVVVVEALCLESSEVAEEALRVYFAQEAEVGQGRDLEVEVVHLKVRDCL